MMTNDELGMAIATTKDMLAKTGTAYAEHDILVEHFTKLLAEQLKRAASQSSDVGTES
jgi:hypothetical protein